MAKEKRVRLTTPPFVVGFPNVFEKTSFKTKSGEQSKPSYNLVAIFEPKSYTGKEKERWDAMIAEMDAQCIKLFGKKWSECKKLDPETGEKGVPDFKEGLYPGKRKAQTAGFGEGKYYCTLKTYNPPGVVQYVPGGKSTDISEADGNTDLIYAGITARATIGVFAYDEPSKGVSFWLNNLQKLKDGERLDGRGNAADDFEDDVDGSWADQEEPSVGGEFD